MRSRIRAREGFVFRRVRTVSDGGLPPAPVADFSGDPLTGDMPLSVAFTDESTNTPTSWLWDFGDGDTSTSQNPTHEYADAGTYTVSLTSSNTGGPDTITKIDYITVSAGGENFMLLESGDFILLESGDKILLEA